MELENSTNKTMGQKWIYDIVKDLAEYTICSSEPAGRRL